VNGLLVTVDFKLKPGERRRSALELPHFATFNTTSADLVMNENC
jgi:hypothetical protein